MTMGSFVDLTGSKFHRWTVLCRSEIRKNNKVVWECKCECGNEGLVTSYELTKGRSKSCGCLTSDVMKKRMTTHGDTGGGKTSRLFSIWKGMKQRASNPNTKMFKRYGGRGIVLCEEWKNDFAKFKEWALDNGYEDNLTIDRINNDGNYEPSNCRWADWVTQSRNKSDNTWITIDKETKTLSEWCEISPNKRNTVRGRIQRGWDPKKAVYCKPIEKTRKKVSS